jgi:hypothetical protein
VLAVKASMVIPKFRASANSLWHYFNNTSHWVERETFFIQLLLYAVVIFKKVPPSSRSHAVFFPVVSHHTIIKPTYLYYF